MICLKTKTDLTLKYFTLCPSSVFRISHYLYCILIEAYSVYCTIRAEFLNQRQFSSQPYSIKVHILHCVLTKVTN